MATTIRLFLIVLLLAIFNISCRTSQETITICGKKYDVYKDTEYNYEQQLYATYNTVCFHKSKYYAFAYQTHGIRKDSNLIYTFLRHSEDSLIVSTLYDKSVFGYDYEGHRYFRCLANGFFSLNSDLLITKKTAKKMNYKLKR